MNLARFALWPCCAVCALAGRSAANDTLFMNTALSGATLVRIGDVDADGRPDLAESDGYFVRWVSSANGAILRSVDFGNVYGGSIALVDAGDLDGDGVSDLAAGLNGVRAYSGATGQVLWQIASTNYGFGDALARIDDRDGDGRPEIVVGVTEMYVHAGGDVFHFYYEGDGRAEVRSGANGALLATIRPAPGSTSGFGGSIAVLDDFDGDSIREIAIAPFYQPVGAPGPLGAGGDVYVVSGASFATLATIPPPPNVGSRRVTALGDLDGDGFDEFALARIWDSVEIVSYAAGSVRTHAAQTGYDRVGQAVLALDDLDSDGVPDYAIGSPQPQQVGTYGSYDAGPGVVRAYSGATGAVIWTIAGTEPYGRFGWSLASVVDIDGDLLADLAVASPYAPRIAALSGATRNTMPNAYCVGGLLTGTLRARLLHTGTTSVTANDLSLVVTDTLPGQSGLFVYAHSASMITFGAGWRCVGSPFFRLGPVVTTGSGGSATRPLDLTAPPASGGPGAIGVGTTAYFQFLFRDLLPFHGGRNASSALAVTFVP